MNSQNGSSINIRGHAEYQGERGDYPRWYFKYLVDLLIPVLVGHCRIDSLVVVGHVFPDDTVYPLAELCGRPEPLITSLKSISIMPDPLRLYFSFSSPPMVFFRRIFDGLSFPRPPVDLYQRVHEPLKLRVVGFLTALSGEYRECLVHALYYPGYYRILITRQSGEGGMGGGQLFS